MSARPVLGLLVGPEPPAGVGVLLRVLDRWCVPRAVDVRVEAPAAWLATSPRAPGLRDALDRGRPAGVWVADTDEAGMVSSLPSHEWTGAVVMVTDDPSVAAHHDVVVVGGDMDVPRYPYLSPFVRRRWRAAARLPAAFVASVGDDGDDAFDEAAVPTVLALASAVAVSGPLLLDALAWGAPCATDAESAAMAGARDGQEVVIAEPGELLRAATALTDDDLRAAEMSRAGRLLVERRHDRSRTPLALARRLGLVGMRPTRALDEALDELWTPPRARIRDRVEDAMAALMPA
jgi:hypothetical protein